MSTTRAGLVLENDLTPAGSVPSGVPPGDGNPFVLFTIVRPVILNFYTDRSLPGIL
jgi:hypothetical protein